MPDRAGGRHTQHRRIAIRNQVPLPRYLMDVEDASALKEAAERGDRIAVYRSRPHNSHLTVR